MWWNSDKQKTYDCLSIRSIFYIRSFTQVRQNSGSGEEVCLWEGKFYISRFFSFSVGIICLQEVKFYLFITFHIIIYCHHQHHCRYRDEVCLQQSFSHICMPFLILILVKLFHFDPNRYFCRAPNTRTLKIYWVCPFFQENL